jgi:hypothetical protein
MSEAKQGLDTDAAAQEAGAHEPERLRCEFEHPFFLYFHHNGGGHFRFDEVTGASAFVVRMGERTEFTLPVPQLAVELGLHDSDTQDARRLRLAAEAVSYVETLDLGAELPSEVITGKPSWVVPEPFLRAAKAAIGARISAWIARGREAGLELPPEMTETLTALADGVEPSGATHRMTLRSEGLVEELAYILCLRQRSGSAVAALRAGVTASVNVFTPQTPPGEAAAGLLRVIEAAQKRLEKAGTAAEAVLDDIIGSLREPGAACSRLSEKRNQLYPEVRRLEAAAMPWRGVMPGRDAATKELVFRTYRQMGRRDLPADAWAALENRLAVALLPRGSAPRKVEPDRVRVWFQQARKTQA